MKTLTYTGMMSFRDHGEASDILFISSREEPLAEVLADEISGHIVTVRYWITDEQATREEAQGSFLRQLVGLAEARFEAAYSEITGYLWTDKDIVIGGHDLMAELSSDEAGEYVNAGKWLILEADLHEETEQ